MLTDLVPDHVGQGADELWGGVAVALEGLLVDHLADGEPEGCFEALGVGVSYLYEILGHLIWIVFRVVDC